MKGQHSQVRIVAFILTVGLVAAAPAAAMAQTTDDRRGETAQQESDHTRARLIRRAKDRALAAIDRRVDTLERLTSRVSGNGHIASDHAAVLLADYAATEQGLSSLAGEIEAAETIAAVLRLAARIATDHRVYVVVVPKSHEVIASATVVAVADRFDDAADRLAGAISRAEEAGTDVTEARRWLAVAHDEIGEATRAGGPVAESVIGLQAADWPNPAQGALRDGAARLRNARIDLHQAHAALLEGRDALRDAVGDAAGE